MSPGGKAGALLTGAGDSGWGEVGDRLAVAKAMKGVDTLFHLAAYGGYMPEIAKFVEVNSLGTARLLEVIRDQKEPVRKVVVASSPAVYIWRAVECEVHGVQQPPRRPERAMAARQLHARCP